MGSTYRRRTYFPRDVLARAPLPLLPAGALSLVRGDGTSPHAGRKIEVTAIPPKIDRRRPIEGEKGKKKKKRKRRKKNLLFTRRPRPCAVAALARGCSFSRARRRNVSP
ncbi:hypothetical protein B296_00034379 [Ensete ventricosum]|uniref:Uncharacterized protein n=1 Tax=Ensete ventricosum TaxID=4639 RepID=A0A426ZV58_ENSVE|nr:hypothetical protein B296_00034379 [Ensete ventricosum]